MDDVGGRQQNEGRCGKHTPTVETLLMGGSGKDHKDQL